MSKIREYKNKEVVVRANGIIYKGVLKEITEDAVNLRGLTGWIEIPISKITSIRLKGEDDEKIRENKFVDKSFWDFPPDDESKPK